MKKALVALSLMGLAPAVLAQYSGTVGDLNTIFNPPSNVNSVFCNHLDDDPNDVLGANKKSACDLGVLAANKMAEQYATKVGEYLGCLDGFYQGINEGYNAGKNPTAEMIQRANSTFGQMTPDSARQRGINLAIAEGTTESADQIITRYRRVLGQKNPDGSAVLPNKDYKYPEITFHGYNNGYNYDMTNGNLESGRDFRDVYNAGWVNSRSSLSDKIAASKAYMLQSQHAQSLCNVNDTIFGRTNDDFNNYSFWDYLRKWRRDTFKKYHWDDGSMAFNLFIREGDIHDVYGNYANLRRLTVPTIEEYVKVPAVYEDRTREVPRTDANGNKIPVMTTDANGNPVQAKDPNTGDLLWEMETITERVQVKPPVMGQRIVNKPISSGDADKLQRIYRSYFEKAYERYYAKQYASLRYHTEGQKYYNLSKIIGQQIGEDVAEQTANANAYDQQYRVVSASAFKEKLYQQYELSFDRLIKIFENNPVVELNSAYAVGAIDDSIFTAGEPIRVVFQATNLGEVTDDISLSLQGSGTGVIPQGKFVFRPEALEKSDPFTTPVLGNLSRDLMADDFVTINYEMKNPNHLEDVAHVLRIRKNQKIDVSAYAEIQNVNTNLSLLTGDLGILVNVHNPATIESPMLPQIKVSVLGEVVTKNMMAIAAKGTVKVAIGFNSIDPLEIINRGGSLSGKVETVLDNQTAHQAQFSASITGNKRDNIVKYFSALSNGITTNSGRQSIAARLTKLKNSLESYLSQELSGQQGGRAIRWHRQNEVEPTVVGELQKAYARAKRDGNLTDAGQEQFAALAKEMAKNVAKKGKGRVRRKKKFLEALKVFAPNLSTRVRDHK